MDHLKEANALNRDATVQYNQEDISPDHKQGEKNLGTETSYHDGLLPISIVGAFLGMLVGMIPSILGILLLNDMYAVLFLTIPIGICGGIILLKGCHDKRALILTIIFSILGAYLTIVIYEAAIYAALYNMKLYNIPLVAALMIGDSEIWHSISLDSIYAFIFITLGIWISWEIFSKKGINHRNHNGTD